MYCAVVRNYIDCQFKKIASGYETISERSHYSTKDCFFTSVQN